MKAFLIAGNWKCNGRVERVRALLDGLDGGGSLEGVKVALFPAFVHLPMLLSRGLEEGFAFGAQDVSAHPDGAYTGEVSAAMLADLGCAYAIVGHSERRALFGETDEVVAGKAERALAEGVVPIVCVGETLADREAGSTEAVVMRQLAAIERGLGADGLRRVVVAYEPVWAIGTGVSATPVQAQEVHGLIRAWLLEQLGPEAIQVPLLYGGSMKASTAGALLRCPDIDGGLVGGASLDPAEFLAICRVAAAVAASGN